MSTGRRTINGVIADVQSIPPAFGKIVQSLKEIVNCSEAEIYATLRDCNMDPNEAVTRLLSQDPFHEVKSKRDKKKEVHYENKDLPETKSRVGTSTSYRGSKSDRYVGRGGSTQISSSNSSAPQRKVAYKKENGTNPYTTYSSVPEVAVDNSIWRSSTTSDAVTIENKASKGSVLEGMSASQNNSGYQSAWVGVPGQKSLADIVKMGIPQSNASSTLKSSHSSGNHHFGHVPKSTEYYHDRPHENQHSKVTYLYGKPEAVPHEWPLPKQPQGAIFLSDLESRADSQIPLYRSDLPYDKTSQHTHSENEFEPEEEESYDNFDDYHVGSATISGRAQEIKSRNASIDDNDMYNKLVTDQPHKYSFQNDIVEDGMSASVLSETANLQHLSIQKEEHKPSYEEDAPSVVIPNHLQVQTADCSHLSFGSFGSDLATGLSVSSSSTNNIEETPVVVDGSVIRKTNTRRPEYYGMEPVVNATDESLPYRAGRVDGTFNAPSASQSDFLKQKSEVTHGSQNTFNSDSSVYPFEKVQQENSAYSYLQANSQMKNLASLSGAMHQANTNPISSTLLAENVPVRDSELSYLPFSMAQSVASKFGNTESSISGSSSIFMEEASKTGSGYQPVRPTPQNLTGQRVAPEQSVPQQLAANQYSPHTHSLGPFSNMIGYPYLPQNYTYMPSAFQQEFTGNGPYHQSLTSVPPQYKNSASISSLPQSAAAPSGYGNSGNLSAISGNYAMNPSPLPAGSTIGYDDLLSSLYKDNSHLSSLQHHSLQQNENTAMRLLGHHGLRTTPAVPSSTYYSLHSQTQQHSGFRQGHSPNYGGHGNASFYNAQMGMQLDHQLQNPRDGSLGGTHVQLKQQQQIWQNSYY